MSSVSLPPLHEFEYLPDELVERFKALTKGAADVATRSPEIPSGDCAEYSYIPRSVDVDRARKYLAKLPPSIDGAGGHASLFVAATAMVHGFALDDETAFSLLATDFNCRCEPPWSEKEIRHKIAQVHEHPPTTDVST